MTQAIARPLGIAVHDHLIVGKDGHASLKAMKLIQRHRPDAGGNAFRRPCRITGVAARC
jgi:hypothetical protein